MNQNQLMAVLPPNVATLLACTRQLQKAIDMYHGAGFDRATKLDAKRKMYHYRKALEIILCGIDQTTVDNARAKARQEATHGLPLYDLRAPHELPTLTCKTAELVLGINSGLSI